MAGSERPSQSKAEGERLREGGEINYSLLALGRVVSALAAGRHAPFRDSRLTLLLKNAFGGAAVTQVIVCLSAEHGPESRNSVQFATRCAGVRNMTAKVRAEADGAPFPQNEELRRLRDENEALAAALRAAGEECALLTASREKLKGEARAQLLGVMCRAKERESKLKQQFRMIYWDRQRRVAEAEQAHADEMHAQMRQLESDKDYTDLLAFLNLKDDEL